MSSDKDDKEKGIGDVFKKIASLGMGAAFMTEDAVKNLIGDLPLPKDIVSGLIQNAKGAKEDLTKGLRDEFRKYLSKLDTNNIIDYIAQNYDVEVEAKFKLKKKDSSKDQE